MSQLPSHLNLALASIRCFTDDGTLDTDELNYLLGIAKADGSIDDDERRVLAGILAKVSRDDVSTRTWERIGEIRSELGLG